MRLAWFCCVAWLAILVGACSASIRPGPIQAPVEAVRPIPDLVGRIERADRSAQASLGDVANGATVSLIDTVTGKTIATAVSSPDGTFNVRFAHDFVPLAGKLYYLDAAKGLPVGGNPNRAGAGVARLRTLVRFAGEWSSVSGTGIVIGSATTAVCAIAGLKDLDEAAQLALLGKISGTTFDSTGTGIDPDEYTRVLGLVRQALADDMDPLEAVAYDPTGSSAITRFALRGSAMVLHTVSPVLVSGGRVKLTGQNLSGPLDVRIAGQAVASWSVDASRSVLELAPPVGNLGGWVEVRRGPTTYFGPYVAPAGTVGTFAGSGLVGLADGRWNQARFNGLHGLAVDSAGNLYVGDTGNHAIRKVTPDGNVTTLAGNGTAGFADGTGPAARFSGPQGVAVDGSGNVYVADIGNCRIRKISPGGTVTTLAGSGTCGFQDGPASTARFNVPHAVCVDTAGNVYVADSGNHRVRKISTDGSVTTLAGNGTASSLNGTGTAATFNSPDGIAVDAAGNLYMTEYSGGNVRKIAPNNVVTTVVGGVGGPHLLSIDRAGVLWLPAQGEWKVYSLTVGGTKTFLTGTGSSGYVDGLLATAAFAQVAGTAADAAGNVYVADAQNHRIRIVRP